jgi:lysine-specific demethylase 8
MVIEGVFADSKAVALWSPRSFAERFGDFEVSVSIDLPTNSAPYLERNERHVERMELHQLVERLEAGELCYLNQAALEQFPGLAEEIELLLITPPPIYGVNLWFGGPTRSGLHYDSADNFLIQIFGTKEATLVSPRYGRSLRLMPDSPSKSSLSPAELAGPDTGVFSRVPRWSGDVMPGDALFIPRGWWHYLASMDLSISVNVWHADRLEFKDYVERLLRAGPGVWTRTARDFVWCGAFGRPYEQHLFSPPPLGLDYYQRLTRWRRR